MKVYELIEKLQQCDPNADAMIVLNGEWNDVRDVEAVQCEEASISVVELQVN